MFACTNPIVQTMQSRSMSREVATRAPILALPNELLVEILVLALCDEYIVHHNARQSKEVPYTKFLHVQKLGSGLDVSQVFLVCKRFLDLAMQSFFTQTTFRRLDHGLLSLSVLYDTPVN